MIKNRGDVYVAAFLWFGMIYQERSLVLQFADYNSTQYSVSLIRLLNLRIIDGEIWWMCYLFSTLWLCMKVISVLILFFSLFTPFRIQLICRLCGIGLYQTLLTSSTLLMALYCDSKISQCVPLTWMIYMKLGRFPTY